MHQRCCAPQPITEEVATVPTICPRCGSKGKIVPRTTLQSLLLVDLYLLQADQYRFCRTPDCPVAYFAEGGTQIFTGDQVRVPIWQKNVTPTTPVCYCFKVTPAMIREELLLTGASTAIQHISNGIHNDLCACEITNPQGSCCLGNVRTAVAAVEREITATKHAHGDIPVRDLVPPVEEECLPAPELGKHVLGQDNDSGHS